MWTPSSISLFFPYWLIPSLFHVIFDIQSIFNSHPPHSCEKFDFFFASSTLSCPVRISIFVFAASIRHFTNFTCGRDIRGWITWGGIEESQDSREEIQLMIRIKWDFSRRIWIERSPGRVTYENRYRNRYREAFLMTFFSLSHRYI